MWTSLKHKGQSALAPMTQWLEIKWQPYWLGLQPREQKALQVLAGVLLLLSVYLLGLKPAWQAVSQAQSSHQRAVAQWETLVKQAKTVEQLRQTSQGGRVIKTFRTQSALLAFLQQQIRQTHLQSALQQMKPKQHRGHSAIEITFKNAPAPKVWQWLDGLEKGGLVPVTFTLQKEKRQPKGIISAQVVFEVQS